MDSTFSFNSLSHLQQVQWVPVHLNSLIPTIVKGLNRLKKMWQRIQREERWLRRGQILLSLERALQNEMAYRRKFLPYIDSGDQMMPLQVQFPSRNPLRPNLNSSPRLSGREPLLSLSNPVCLPSPTPVQNPFPRPSISSGPRISERKRVAIGSSSNIPPPQQLQAPNNLDHHSFNYYCEDCQVPCSGFLNYKQHINGKKHKLRLQEFGKKDGGVENEKPWCKLCKIWCSDYDLLKMHLAGQKHKKMQAKLEGATTVAGEVVEEQNWCELCGIGCSSKELLQSHFAGKKHKAELKKLEYDQRSSLEAQNQQKRCKVCNILCADKNSLQRHLMDAKHFLNEVDVKKRQWQDLIRAEGNNS